MRRGRGEAAATDTTAGGSCGVVPRRVDTGVDVAAALRLWREMYWFTYEWTV